MRLGPAAIALPARGLAPLAALVLAVALAPASSQAQDEFDDEELVDADELEKDTPKDESKKDKPKKVKLKDDEPEEAAASGSDSGSSGEGEAKKPEAKKAEEPDLGFDAVRAIDRDPRPGTPLIADKLFPMQFHLELTGVFDYSYSDKFIQHIGGHVSGAFHIFDWMAVEGWAGGFYPQELAITRTVRQQGYSFTNLGLEPELGDLWQTIAFGGAGVQWAPLYGKLSIVSEFDLTFQLYFVGGMSVSAIAKPIQPAPGTAINNVRDFFPGVISGQQYNYWVRFDATYGAGLRVIPWKWVAFKFEVRNMTGLNPPFVRSPDAPALDQLFDLTNMPLLNFGISLLI